MNSPAPLPNALLRRIGWAVLALSFCLRALLVWRGGQLFWPDEDRFEITRKIAGLLTDGRLHEALDRLLSQPDHLLFKAAGLVPASLEVLLGTPGWVSGLFFAAASTWVLWLVGRVARAAGGSELQSLVALVLAASATSLFYYSRHFFPYDFSLGLFLLCLLTGLREATSPRQSLLTGLCAGLGFLAYNGYWSLGAVLLGTHVLLALPDRRAMAMRTAYALLGLTLPVFCVAGLSWCVGHDFFALSLSFAGTADQGELERAWLFVVEYFWSAEHGLALLWAFTLLLSLDAKKQPADLRTFLWPGLTVVLGILLILPPGMLNHFAVTARHVRVLAPFLCLTAAMVLCHQPRLRAQPRLLALLLVVVILQAAYNFHGPVTQVFPREFEKMAIAHLAEARKSDLGPYKIVNASFLHNANWAPLASDAGTVQLRRPHPFQFSPYLYEGYSLALRDRYLARDLSMRVVRLDAGGPPLHGYPEGMIELVLRFPERPESLLPEPLLSTGAPGRGDTLFLRYAGTGHFVLGHDHIGGGAVLAPLMPLDRTATHRVLIGMDNFFPDSDRPRAGRRFVMWNDVLLLDGAAPLHPTAPDQIAIGHNFIGASTAIAQLSADIVGFRRIPYPKPGAVFAVPPGTLRLGMLPASSLPAGYAEPLLSSGPAGQGDLLFLRKDGDGRLRVGLDQWGSGAILSRPFVPDASRRLEFTVAMGPFLRPEESSPRLPPDVRRLYVQGNGQVLLNRFVRYHASEVSELFLGENHAASTTVAPGLSSEMLLAEPTGTPPPVAGFTGHPGAVRLALRFDATPAAGTSLPLLSTGRSGAGDLLFIRFDAQGRYQIGHDHWGYSMVLSEPRAFDPAQPLGLTVSLGGLFAPDHDAGALRDRLFVATGNDVLLDQPARFHPVEPGAWVVGVNAIGSSSAGELLPADLLDFSPVSPETIFSQLKTP